MPKKASHCKNGHPRTPENLYPNRLCKLCSIAYTAAYTASHFDHVRDRNREFSREYHRKRRKVVHPKSLVNVGKFCKNGHAWTPKNTYRNGTCKPCACEYQRRYKKEHPDRLLETYRKGLPRTVARHAKYKKRRIAEEVAKGRGNPCTNCIIRDAVPDKLKCSHCIEACHRANLRRKSSAAYYKKKHEHARRYRKLHPEKVNANIRKWQKAHPEKSMEHSRKYHAMMNGNFTHFTQREWESLLDSTGHVCLCCRRTEAELKVVGLLLVPDHVVPICDPSDRLKGHRDDISNIQPLCHSNKLGVYGGCNQIKGGKCTDYRTQKSQY